MQPWEEKEVSDLRSMRESSKYYRPPLIERTKEKRPSTGKLSVDLKILNPFYGLDAIAAGWARITYDTPLSRIPIIGLKSSLNPLGKQYREAYALGEYANKPKKGFFVHLAPMAPATGPPLPEALGQVWPWKKE